MPQLSPDSMRCSSGDSVESVEQPCTRRLVAEQLKGRWHGWWSRRITNVDRLVYGVTGSGDEQRVTIAKCKGHY